MSSTFFSCPFCRLECADGQALAEHLCRLHAGKWGARWLWVSRRGRYARCWCGKSFSTEAEVSPLFPGVKVCPSAFATHLEEGGGAAAHVLACGLGVGDGAG